MGRRKSLLIYTILLALLVVPFGKASPQSNEDKRRVVDWAGGYFAPFVIVGSLPKGFKDFDTFIVEYLPNQARDERLLMPDQNGFIPTTGELDTKDGVSYKFKSSTLIESEHSIELNFVTEKVKDVNYSFKGEYFYRAKEVRTKNKIIGYIELEGVLTKFKEGRKLAQAKVGFGRNVIE